MYQLKCAFTLIISKEKRVQMFNGHNCTPRGFIRCFLLEESLNEPKGVRILEISQASIVLGFIRGEN